MTTQRSYSHAPEFNPHRRFALLTLFATLLITLGLTRLFRDWDYVFAWLIAVNVVTFLTFWCDKSVAFVGATRVPEIILLALTALGGCVGAILARPLFHHKTQKASFRSAFWPCVAVSVALVAIYYFWLCPGCR